MSLRVDSLAKTAPMRGILLSLLLTTTLVKSALAAAQAGSPAEAMHDFSADTKRAICDGLRKDASACAADITSVTENRTGANSAIWAFTARVSAPLRKKGEPQELVKAALQPLTLQVMEATQEGFTVVAYYREADGHFARVPADVFAAAALNPVDKVVARHNTGFFAKNRLRYEVPPVWSAVGLSPGTEGSISFTVELQSAQTWALQLNDLDDTELKDLSIAACTVESGKEPPRDCSANAATLPAGISKLQLRVTARRHLKNSQPAFKFMVRNSADSTVITQLAIPFKPQPNYFLFGITGFLFGGLIAVMVLIVRKNPGARRKMTA